VYIPGHWLTAAANLVDKQLFIYDSYCTVDGRIKLSAAHVKAKTDLFYYIKALLQHHKHQFNAKAWTVQSIEMTPQQPNGYDCGIFTIANIFSLVRYWCAADRRLDRDTHPLRLHRIDKSKKYREVLAQCIQKQQISIADFYDSNDNFLF